MAASDILSLKTQMGTRLIGILYCIAIVLIALGTLQGVVRGARIMMGPPAITAPAEQADAAPAPGAPAMDRPWRRGPRFNGPFNGRAPMLFGQILPHPVAGALRIVFSQERGLVVLLVVRVLAEIGNTRTLNARSLVAYSAPGRIAGPNEPPLPFSRSASFLASPATKARMSSASFGVSSFFQLIMP